MAKSLRYFQTLAASTTTVRSFVNHSAVNKVIIIVYPETRTYDICVLAFGKIVKSNTGSWPLPLEVHVMGIYSPQPWEWVKGILPSLYYIAQPDMSECHVYLPGYYDLFGGDPWGLFSVFAKLGKNFSTQHRLHLLAGSVSDGWKSGYCKAAKKHKISLEFRDF